MGLRARKARKGSLPIVVLVLAATLLLAACERPLQDVVSDGDGYPPPAEATEESGEVAEPTIEAPTLPPATEEATDMEPTAEEATAMPEATDDGGEDESPRTGDGADQEATAEATEEPTAEATMEATEEATPEPTEEATPEGGGESGEERVHVVQAGDNLYRIGLQYGVSWTVLAEYNNLANANDIEVGQQIRIPPGEGAQGEATATPAPQVTHVVQQGETLFIISQQYGVSWPDIAEANNLAPPYTIYAGMSLVIPGD
jgi:LysM repeat protein